MSFTKSEMDEKIEALAEISTSDAAIADRYGLHSNRDWSLPDARQAAREGRAKMPQTVAWRPFDLRWSEFSRVTMDYPRRELLDHVADKNNLSLLCPRQVSTEVWRHIFAADVPAESCLIANETKSQNYVFPLWLFRQGMPPTENLAPDFRAFLDGRYGQHFGAEEIFGYVYAVLSAQAYRARYAEPLRRDFPRIPFPSETENFEDLSRLGWALIRAHLLRELPRRGLAAYPGKGDHTVEAVRYSPDEQAIWINKTQSFAPVPQSVWDFYIGGHQVLDKYLKSRKGRVLTLDEINHVGAVADSLAFTVDQMALIDLGYRKAFPEHG